MPASCEIIWGSAGLRFRKPAFRSENHRLFGPQHPVVLHRLSSWPSAVIGEGQVSHLSLAQRELPVVLIWLQWAIDGSVHFVTLKPKKG
jgi:hypothetical protein